MHARCLRYHVLPGPGGAYDQDEYLMSAMEYADGASRLFDAGPDVVSRFADVHTSLGERAADIIRCFNEREAAEMSAATDAEATDAAEMSHD